MQRLRAAQHRGERLERGADDVVIRLLGGERGAAGLGVEAQHHRAGVFRLEALLGDARPEAAGGAELGDLLQAEAVAGEEEGEAGGKLVELEPGGETGFDVGDGVRHGEADLLRRCAAGLAHVVAADADRVPGRQLIFAVGKDIGDKPDGGAGREDVGAAGDVLLQDVVLRGAADLSQVSALPLGHRHVEREQDRCRGVDRHRRRHLLERNAVEQRLHVAQRADRDAYLADFALRQRVVRVVADLGRQVERYRQAGLALPQQILIALVRLFRRTEAGVLAHRPEPAAIHRRLDASRIGVAAGKAELGHIAASIAVRGQVVRRVERFERLAGAGLEGDVALRRPLARLPVRSLLPLSLTLAHRGARAVYRAFDRGVNASIFALAQRSAYTSSTVSNYTRRST